VLSEQEEKQLIAEVSQSIKRCAGTQPAGWLGPYLAQSALGQPPPASLSFHTA
jgi:hypothetical protein